MSILSKIFGKRKAWENLGSAWAGRAIEYQFRNAEITPENIFLRDRYFRAIPVEDFERLIFDAWFINDNPLYDPEIFDCDDFAVCFMADIKRAWAARSRGNEALAFGYIEAELTTGAHAFIWAIDPGGRINYYEPQTGNKKNFPVVKIRLVEN